MKKILRKITVLITVAALSVLPVSTAYAASVPVRVGSDSNFIYYEYQDQPVLLQPGQSLVIAAEDGGVFNVPPNKYFLLEVEFNTTSPITIEYFRYAPSYLMASGIFDAPVGGFGFVEIPEASTFIVRVTAGSAPAYITGYFVSNYN